MYKKLSFLVLVVSFSVQGMYMDGLLQDMDNLVHCCEMDRRYSSSMLQSEQENIEKAMETEQKKAHKEQSLFIRGSNEMRPKRKYVNKNSFGYFTNDGSKDVFSFSGQNFIPVFPNKNDVEEGKKSLKKYSLDDAFKRIEKGVAKKRKIRDLSSIEKVSVASFFMGDIKY